MPPASIASRLACRDDRDTPLLPSRDAVTIIINCRKTEAVYFLQGGLTRIRKIHLSGKSVGRSRCSRETFARRPRLWLASVTFESEPFASRGQNRSAIRVLISAQMSCFEGEAEM